MSSFLSDFHGDEEAYGDNDDQSTSDRSEQGEEREQRDGGEEREPLVESAGEGRNDDSREEAAAAAAVACIPHDREEEGEASLCQTIRCKDPPLPDIMGQNDPRRMVLTSQERHWASMIKQAIEVNPLIDNLSDYWYANLALICKGNIANAVERAQALQHFRDEYSALDTHKDGCKGLQVMLDDLLPGFVLHFGFAAEEGTYSIVCDLSTFYSLTLSSKKQLDQYFVGCFYLAQALFPDLHSTRRGAVFLADYKGTVLWNQHKKFCEARRIINELWAHYPFHGVVRNYNCGTILNAFLSLSKVLLPKVVRDRFVTGLTFEGGLASIYMVPNVKEATARVRRKMEETLRRRYHNERTFRL